LSTTTDDDFALMPATQPLDILVIAPHPDDAEMLCGGLLWKAKLAGKRMGVVDLTRGEMGTRGTIETRQQEAAAATKLLGSDVFERKVELVGCYQTQFGPGTTKKPGADAEPQTRLSHSNFMEFFRGLHTFYGYQIGARYGEAYCVKSPLRAGLSMLDL
jgi:LmbE family N-acetylglucosaminyl deacetylase